MAIRTLPAQGSSTMAASISSEEQIFMTELGKRITALRKDAGLTQVQLAQALNVSQQAVQSWESGRRRIQISVLPAVARQLSVSLDALLGDSHTPPPRKRGPASRLEQQIQVIGQLPRSRQKLVSEMLDAVIAQAQQAGADGLDG
ncbi:helix-turn-helix domain-containing protein [Dickeya fangzhongdai]|uniref:helix-turn-helix domain-containing protein n=2 Tax=Pectobacteriaceae TaxID=1903410 RepID=UPI001F3F04B3|nr:helix-turn-helix domain-containing protein [Dickeya fangzhongdai]